LERIITTDSSEATSAIFGAFDSNIKLLERAFDVRIFNRNSNSFENDTVVVSGEEESVALAASAIEYLKRMVSSGEVLSRESVEYVVSLVRDKLDGVEKNFFDNVISVTNRGKPIKPKTVGQKRYVRAIKDNTVVIGTGPAGTGKTFLAVAMACEALRNKEITRIILTRPAVEAGERLGFLPGDLQSKIDPYLRPLYDALYEMLGAENYQKHLEKGTIEIAPLAYMRGRTLDDSFIILDEAQNTTPEQMKMFLTRLGFGSKAVVTGDLSQTDLPLGKKSGLAIAKRILDGIEGIAVFEFSERDVVRHSLVRKIISAYDKYEREQKTKAATFRVKDARDKNEKKS